jgi:hypothetical protein
MRQGTRVIWRKLDCLNPNLQQVQRRTHRHDVWGRCRACGGLMVWPPHLPGSGAMSNEDI